MILGMPLAHLLLAGALSWMSTGARAADAACEAARCSCVRITDIRAHRDRMSDVFVGEVLGRRDMGGTRARTGPALPVEQLVTLRVRKRWKGARSDTITVRAGKDEAMCGIAFRLGERYLVFAQQDRGTLVTSLCELTALEALSSRNLRVLGRPLRQR